MPDGHAAPHVPARASPAAAGAADVAWAPRVSRSRIHRLYALDALGVVDDELIDQVGFALEARCRSILAVHDAQRGQVHCPRCAREDQQQLIPHQGRLDETLRCAVCGWQCTWDEYRKTYRRKQLNSGGALPAFVAYLHRFRQATNPRQKMLAIDRLIHEYHFSLRDQPDLPTRPAGVNLIEGSMVEVIRLLEDLAYGPESAPELRATEATWRHNEQRRRALWASFQRRNE